MPGLDVGTYIGNFLRDVTEQSRLAREVYNRKELLKLEKEAAKLEKEKFKTAMDQFAFNKELAISAEARTGRQEALSRKVTEENIRLAQVQEQREGTKLEAYLNDVAMKQSYESADLEYKRRELELRQRQLDETLKRAASEAERQAAKDELDAIEQEININKAKLDEAGKKLGVYKDIAEATGIPIQAPEKVGEIEIPKVPVEIPTTKVPTPQMEAPYAVKPEPIPEPKPEVKERTVIEYQSYTVQEGEKPVTIAGKFNIPVESLVEANRDKLKTWGKTKGFNVGETIQIPVEKVITEEAVAPEQVLPKTVGGGPYPQEMVTAMQRPMIYPAVGKAPMMAMMDIKDIQALTSQFEYVNPNLILSMAKWYPNDKPDDFVKRIESVDKSMVDIYGSLKKKEEVPLSVQEYVEGKIVAAQAYAKRELVEPALDKWLPAELREYTAMVNDRMAAVLAYFQWTIMYDSIFDDKPKERATIIRLLDGKSKIGDEIYKEGGVLNLESVLQKYEASPDIREQRKARDIRDKLEDAYGALYKKYGIRPSTDIDTWIKFVKILY